MADSLGELSFAISWDMDNKPIDDASKKVDSFKKNVKGIGDTVTPAQQQFNNVFDGMGRAAAKAGKAIAAGIGVGVAALGFLAKSSLDMSGELEQNLGGSEAVFKDFAGPMQDIGKTAYKDMGLSQSDFLATANKMGALFKGAGFDIAKASDLSSKTMQRAADVASIMGIDISAAMESVAGAAKGNFTMMDNLGVAMNDTSIGAYAMSKGIKKATKDMTQQEKIGLAMEMFLEKTAYSAGNYAKENDTLAGSMNTLKGAWGNFMSGAGDASAVITSFSNVATIVVGKIKEQMPVILSGISQMVKTAVTELPTFLRESVAGTSFEGIGNTIASGFETVVGILQTVKDNLNWIVPVVGSLAGAYALVTAAVQGYNIVTGIMKGIEIAGAIAKGTMTLAQAGETTAVMASTAAWWANAVAVMAALWPILLIIAAVAAVIAITILIVKNWGAIVDFFKWVWAKICEGFQVAADWIKGLWNGIVGWFKGLWDSVVGIFNGVINWVKSNWQSIVLFIINPFAGIFKYLYDNFAGFRNVVNTVVNFVVGLFVIAGEWIYTTFISPVAGFFTSLWNSIVSGVTTAWNWICGLLLTVGTWIWDNVLFPIISFYVNAYITIWNGLVAAWNWVVGLLSTIGGWIYNNVIAPVIGFFVNLGTSIGNAFSTAWNFVVGIWQAVSSWFDTTVIQPVTGFFTGIGTAIQSAFSGALDFVKGIWDGAVAWFKGVADKIGAAFSFITGKGAQVTGVDGFAGGVTNFKGGAAIVGEKGPELVNLPKGADVIPNNKTERLLSFGGSDGVISGGGSSGDIYNTYDINIKIDAPNADSNTVRQSEDNIAAAVEKAVEKMFKIVAMQNAPATI